MVRLPDFFIVGAPKAGTTSLYVYLGKHPEIFMSPVKEPNFFSFEEIKKQGLYYKKENIETLKEYMALFEEAGEQQKVGEASVSYLFYPSVPAKIKKAVPNAKIIILLRNPVERAFSHYLMDLKLGYVDIDFEKVVMQKTDHVFSELYYQQYVKLGFYYEQVKRYIDTFGKENIFIILTDELESSPFEIYKKVCDFLGVSLFEEINFEKFNAYMEPAGSFVKFVYSLGFLRTLVKKIVSNERARGFIRSKLFKKQEKPVILDNVRNFLINLYKKDIEKLESLISKDLSDWYLK